MIEGIPIPLLTEVGAGILLTLVVLLILTGKLVPKSTLDDALAQRDRAQVNLDRRGETIHQQAVVIDKLTTAAELQSRVMEAVQDANSEGGG